MKHMLGRAQWARRTLALLCALLLAVALAPNAAQPARAEGGTLSVKLPEYVYQALPPDAKVTFRLCQIGVADQDSSAGWQIYDALKGYGVLAARTTSQLNQVAQRMAGEAGPSLEGVTAVTEARTATFGGLADGVYLGYMTDGPQGIEVVPFIVTLPVRDADTGELVRVYDLTVKAAYAPTTTVTSPPAVTPAPTPVVTPTPTPVATPTPVPTDTPRPSNPPRGGNNPPRPTLIPNTEISGKKIWVDESDAHHTRPQRITVQLYADNARVDAEPTWTSTDGDEWSYSFGRLPAMTEDGARIQYSVRELPVEGYSTRVSGMTITNTLDSKKPAAYRDLSGVKTWVDGDNADGTRPNLIVVRLLRDGAEVASRTVTAATGWKYTFENQPVDDGYGNAYEYTVTEDAVKGYFFRVKGLDLTNTSLGRHTPEDGPEGPGGETGRYTVKGNPEVPSRHTGTPRPGYANMTEEELEELFDLFGYGTPLWGELLGTGDETPLAPWLFAGLGILALAALMLTGRRRRAAGSRKA